MIMSCSFGIFECYQEFEELLSLVGRSLLKNCRNRESISQEERLSFICKPTLRGAACWGCRGVHPSTFTELVGGIKFITKY